jgi:hypothetical protein
MKKLFVVFALVLVALSANAVFAAGDPKPSIEKIAQLEVRVERTNTAFLAKLIEAENLAYNQGLEAISAGEGKKALEYFSAYEEYLKMHDKIPCKAEYLIKKKEASAQAAIQFLRDEVVELANGKFDEAEKSREIIAQYWIDAQQ